MLKSIWIFIQKHNTVIKLTVTLVLISRIAVMLDLRRLSGIFDTFTVHWYAAAIAVMCLNIAVSAYKWYRLLRYQHVAACFPDIVKIVWVSVFYNQLLPGRIGGDFIKAWYILRRNTISSHSGRIKITLSIVVDRLFNIIGLLVIGTAAFMLDFRRNMPFLVPVVLAAAALCAATVTIACLSLYRRKSKNSRPNGLMKYISDIVSYFREYLNNRRSNLFLLSWSVFYQFMAILSVLLLGIAVGIRLPFTVYLFVVPLVFIATILPVSFGGIGVRESTFIYLMSGYGVAEELSFALSLLIYLSLTLVSLPGVFIRSSVKPVSTGGILPDDNSTSLPRE